LKNFFFERGLDYSVNSVILCACVEKKKKN